MSARTDYRELTKELTVNCNVAHLLSSNRVQYCYCRRISDVLKGVELDINSQGFSEFWDRAGLYVGRNKDYGTARTIYLAEQGWDDGEPYKYSLEKKRHTRSHETGHAVDECLGSPSLSDDFTEAWIKDIANFRCPQDVKETICGRLLTEKTGPRELWADFYAFSDCGRPGAVGVIHFPLAVAVFNRQVCELGIGPIKLPDYKHILFPEQKPNAPILG